MNEMVFATLVPLVFLFAMTDFEMMSDEQSSFPWLPFMMWLVDAHPVGVCYRATGVLQRNAFT
jgi:hypothetical protein